MRKPIVLGSLLFSTLAVAVSADAATLYVSPTGTGSSGCTRDAACDVSAVAGVVQAGDTVILMDGLYQSKKINVVNSGTSSAWITFQADECATPILEGDGQEPTVDDGDGGTKVEQPTGVGSSTGTYLRFVGLVSRGWNTGFGNGWTGEGTTNSNGHQEYQYCIGDANGRTGFTFYSAEGIHIQNCISAHNGSSAHSWSSGVTLYQAQGANNLVEGTVSFENMDAQKRTDGSGFIADENSNNARFINNLAFRNAGSCLRLTKSSGVRFINNTCYHNAQDPLDDGPPNPGEVYVSDNASQSGQSFFNNLFISTGTGPGAEPIYGQPSTGWSNNVIGKGSVSYWTSPDGNNPDFTLSSSASNLIGKGTSGTGAPTNDLGFNPRCIVKRTPTTYGIYTNGSWWQYSVDYDYIKSIGGVAKCFNPKNRSGTPDIGAYANGAVNTAGACVPTATGGTSGTGGSPSTGGTTASGGVTNTGGTSNAGGTTSTGGNTTTGGVTNAGGTTSSGGNTTTGGTSNAGGTTSSGGGSSGGGTKSGGSSSAAGTTASSGGSTNTGGGGRPGSGGTSASSGGSTSNGGNASPTGGSTSSGGSPSGGGSSTSSGGVSNTGGGSSSAGSSTGGSGKTGGTGAASGVTGAGAAQQESGCGCRVAGESSRSTPFGALGLLGLVTLGVLRRRRAR